MVEKTAKPSNGFRRMQVRYARKAEAIGAWTDIAAIAICLGFAE